MNLSTVIVCTLIELNLIFVVNDLLAIPRSVLMAGEILLTSSFLFKWILKSNLRCATVPNCVNQENSRSAYIAIICYFNINAADTCNTSNTLLSAYYFLFIRNLCSAILQTINSSIFFIFFIKFTKHNNEILFLSTLDDSRKISTGRRGKKNERAVLRHVR